MISFKDREFCSAPCKTVACSRRWTPELAAEAERWWNPKGCENMDGAPVAFRDYSKSGCPDYRPSYTEEGSL